MQKIETSFNESDKYRKRKIWFWVIFALFLLLTAFLVYYLLNHKKEKTKNMIRVGICGAVHRPAVYDMISGSDLAMLVRRANGLTPDANILHVDMERLLMNDTIYHIPGRGKGIKTATDEIGAAMADAMKNNFKELTDKTIEKATDKEIRQINVLYVGFPAVFMIINYYPDFKRVSITHIPHTTRFLNNDYRLLDIFFTLGINPTVKLLENRLNQKIDYYLIQDRFSFIDLVDMLDGIDVNLDQPYAESYNLKAGVNHIDGFHTWEYIRFLDLKRIKRNQAHTDGKVDLFRKDNFQADPSEWGRAYEERQHRQKVVMTSLRKAYNQLNPAEQVDVLNKIAKTFETNIGADILLKLYKDVLSSPDFSYGTVPGYYDNEAGKLFFYPDIPSFNLLRKEQIRTYMEKKSEKLQTIY